MNKKKQGNDCYSAGERGAMVWWENWRAQKLHKGLVLLDKGGITPNILTFLSLLSGIIAALILPFYTITSFVLLILHVVLDGLDGPLARFQKIDSAKGSFTDTMSDQIVLVAIILSCMYIGVAEAIISTIYVFIYTIVIAFSMVRNRLNIPYSWLVRPRFVLYLCLPITFYIWVDAMNGVLWVCSFLLTISLISGFYKIRKKL